MAETSAADSASLVESVIRGATEGKPKEHLKKLKQDFSAAGDAFKPRTSQEDDSFGRRHSKSARGEIPREGVMVQRVPALIRTADGRSVRSMARRIRVGRGDGSSGLAFDNALPRR